MTLGITRRRVVTLAAATGAWIGAGRLAQAGERAMTSPKKHLFKAVYLVKRKAGMSFDDHVTAQHEHSPLAHALPGLRHYVLDFYPDAEGQPQPFDTAASVYFDSRAAHDAALASPEGQAALADLPRYLDTSATVVLAGYEDMDLSFDAG